MDCIEKYFELSEFQREKLNHFAELFKDWNSKINLVSRKDIDNLCQNHILHSLSIAKYANLNGKKVIDVGTGGGFPGIPLAIMFEKANFVLIDSIGKKIIAVEEMLYDLKLENAIAMQKRSNELKDKCDIVVARAVSSFPKFLMDVKHLLPSKGDGSNGIIYLKGADYNEEKQVYKNKIKIVPIQEYFDQEYFNAKFIVHYKI
jgi:16S rRNA (guanine527-N7)-methyltransferase